MKLAAVVLGFGLMADANAMVEDDPLLTKVMVEQLEFYQVDDEPVWHLAAQAWVGKDLNKLWLKTEYQSVDGQSEHLELQLLYSKAVAVHWDLQLGWRKDFAIDASNAPATDWAVIGLQGLAPYFFAVDAAVFIGSSGRSALRLAVEYELLLSQQLILSPQIELNIHSQNDPASGMGSGLSEVELGLRLRYEVVRELAPYVGVSWSTKYGNTADYALAAGEHRQQFNWLIGVSGWF